MKKGKNAYEKLEEMDSVIHKAKFYCSLNKFEILRCGLEIRNSPEQPKRFADKSQESQDPKEKTCILEDHVRPRLLASPSKQAKQRRSPGLGTKQGRKIYSCPAAGGCVQKREGSDEVKGKG